MKPCSACGQSLRKESFSKKQWQAKKCRRCKNCIGNNLQTMSEAELNLASLPSGGTAANDAPPEQMLERENSRKVEAWTDEDLFRAPPPREDCPICFIRLPVRNMEISYQSCCGKIICNGCVYTFELSGKCFSCPFCRTPEPLTEREINKRLMKRAKDNDHDAMHILGFYYSRGSRGLPRDPGKAMELWLRAGELGSAASYFCIGKAYQEGEGEEVNMQKANYYYTLAAIRGCADGRFKLGSAEYKRGDADRAVKHFMISAGCGNDDSLATIRELYAQGHTSKGDFERALRSYGKARAEAKSDQREAASMAYNT